MTDEQWAVLAPLIEEARPKGKVPPHDLRRTIEAIVWRHANGAKWRAIPASLGPGGERRSLSSAGDSLAHGNDFSSWRRAEAWSSAWRFWTAAASVRTTRRPERAERGIRGKPRKKEALGRSRGGFGTKACVLADGAGRAIAFALAPGQAHELPMAPTLIDQLARAPLWIVGDRGYSSGFLRELIWAKGSRPAIPTKRNEEALACPDYIYNNRNMIERLWARLKEWRAVATRYEKTASSYLGVLCLAATLDWLKPLIGPKSRSRGPVTGTPRGTILEPKLDRAIAPAIRHFRKPESSAEPEIF